MKAGQTSHAYDCSQCLAKFQVLLLAGGKEIDPQVTRCPFCAGAVSLSPPQTPEQRKREVEEAARRGFYGDVSEK
jgi:hypothetical protein